MQRHLCLVGFSLCIHERVCITVIQVADLSTDVMSVAFISTMEERLAHLFSLAMSSPSSDRQRRRRAASDHNATVQVYIVIYDMI